MEKFELDLLETLYDRYSKNLYLVAKYRLDDDEKAQDAVQMVFLVAASKIRTLKSHQNKKAWLYQTMQNIVKQLLYNKKYTKENYLREILTDQIDTDKYIEPIEIEDLGLIEELKDVLKEREYKYLVERFVNEKTTQEIANSLGLSYSATTSFGNRVMNKVKKHMEQRNEENQN